MCFGIKSVWEQQHSTCGPRHAIRCVYSAKRWTQTFKTFLAQKRPFGCRKLGKAKNRWLTFYIMDRQAISWSNYPPDPELSMPHHWFLFGVSKNLNCPCCEGRMRVILRSKTAVSEREIRNSKFLPRGVKTLWIHCDKHSESTAISALNPPR